MRKDTISLPMAVTTLETSFPVGSEMLTVNAVPNSVKDREVLRSEEVGGKGAVGEVKEVIEKAFAAA